ncbi:MAG: ATP-binding protein, partial [Nitrosarchaeum sp.]|nr:ATP-binding protein [Nitrosarchaeum sp.]
MLLGTITGKTTTSTFTFEAKPATQKLDYVQVHHPACDYVLAHIIEMERTQDRILATCNVIGYKDPEGKIRQPRSPFDHGSEVFRADDSFIREVIRLDEKQEGAYIGKLEGKDIKVHLDLQRLLTKHVSILAKSGAGKSYTVGVLLEEILERRVPILIIDPHGEYATLGTPAENTDTRMATFEVTPKAYTTQVYGDPTLGEVKPLKLPNTLTQEELIHLFPGKLNSTQMGILYSALKSIQKLTFS